jgi:protein-disulfide isomerase
VRIVYKMHPLPNHSFAQRAAQAALAAQEQGKFIEMHELLLSRYRTFATLGQQKAAALGLTPEQRGSAEVQDAVFVDFARELGLDEDRFLATYNAQGTKARIVAETREAVSVGATGTPASFVNGRYIRGAAPYAKFQALVDQALGEGTTTGAMKPNP